MDKMNKKNSRFIQNLLRKRWKNIISGIGAIIFLYTIYVFSLPANIHTYFIKDNILLSKCSTTNLTVKKEWSDSEKVHDSITVTLWKKSKGGVSESTGRTLTLNDKNNWQGVFDNLEIPSNSKEFAYSAVEKPVDGYKTEYGTINKVKEKWILSKDKELKDGKTYVFRIKDSKPAAFVLDHTKDNKLIRGNIKANEDGTMSDVPESAKWTVKYNKQDKKDGFIFSNYDNGTFYMKGDHCSNNEVESNHNKYIPSEGIISYGENSKDSLKYNEQDKKYHTVEYKDNNLGKIDKFDLYELDSKSGTYETVIKNTYIGKSKDSEKNEYKEEKNKYKEENMYKAKSLYAVKNEDDEFTYTKTIDSFRDGIDNPDTTLDNNSSNDDKLDLYRLYLTAKADIEPMDIVFVVDASGSMNQRDMYFEGYGNVARDTAVTIALNGSKTKSTPNGLISEVLSLNKDNKVSVVNFFGKSRYTAPYTYKIDSSVLLDWTNKAKFVDCSNKYNNGTNYDAGLSRASEMFGKITGNKNKKVLIFISDGVPTYFIISKTDVENQDEIKGIYGNTINRLYSSSIGSRWGNGVFSDRNNYPFCKLPSEWSFDNFEANHGNSITTYAVGVSNDIDGTSESASKSPDVLKYYAENGGGEFFGAKDGDKLRNQLSDIFDKYAYKQLVITDTLSESVNLHETQPDIKVTMSKDKDKVILWQNGSVTKAGKNILKTVKISGKTISAIFYPGVSMKDEYNYTISFNVKTTQKAYENYAKNGYGKIVGDKGTDYGTNTTSSGKPGFYSNSSANVSYTRGNKVYSKDYLKPVVQVFTKDITIEKTNPKGDKLKDVYFKLYKADENWNKIGAAINGTNNKTDVNGLLSFKKLPHGNYLLYEIKTNKGYILPVKPWKISLNYVKVNNSFKWNVSFKDSTGKNVVIKNSNYQITNYKPYKLPSTGGMGTYWFTFAGVAVMVTAILFYIKSKKRGDKK